MGNVGIFVQLLFECQCALFWLFVFGNYFLQLEAFGFLVCLRSNFKNACWRPIDLCKLPYAHLSSCPFVLVSICSSAQVSFGPVLICPTFLT